MRKFVDDQTVSQSLETNSELRQANFQNAISFFKLHPKSINISHQGQLAPINDAVPNTKEQFAKGFTKVIF